MRKIKQFKLEVNGKRIGTKRFVKEFIANSLLGQVECLRLKETMKVDTIALEVTFEDEEKSE
ncbi:MAG: hypothetical protein ACTSW1_15680 [Candidatus Hodarchaeales archaeon]